MAAFERDGYVLMKAPLTEPELDEAEATFDRLLAQPGPEQPSWAKWSHPEPTPMSRLCMEHHD